MKRLLWLASLAGLCLLLGLAVARVPATLAATWLLANKDTEVRLQSTAGTVWQGTSRLYGADGYLGHLAWELHFVQLLLGRIVLDFELTGPQESTATPLYAIKAQAQLQKSALALSKIKATADPAWLIAALTDGRAYLQAGQPVKLEGTGRWQASGANKMLWHAPTAADLSVFWPASTLAMDIYVQQITYNLPALTGSMRVTEAGLVLPIMQAAQPLPVITLQLTPAGILQASLHGELFGLLGTPISDRDKRTAVFKTLSWDLSAYLPSG